MRNSCSASVKTKVSNRFDSEEEAGEWTSPSQLSVEAVTLLSKSDYFPWFVLLVYQADL